MTENRRERGSKLRLDMLIALTLAAGTALFVGQVVRPEAFQIARAHPGELLVFFVLVVACEIRPIMVARAGEVAQVVTSTTFVFATFLSLGPAAAMLAQAAASLVADVAGAKGARRAGFNIGQYWVSWGFAGYAYQAIAGSHRFTEAPALNARDVAAVAAAALVYFVVNSSLVGLVVAAHSQVPILANIATTAVSEAASDWVLLALAPIVSAVGARSVALLPLLVLPVIAVYRSASVSLEKEHQALHDALTDLPNRLLFGERLNTLLTGARRHHRKVAVLLIDLDRFKEVNDTLGHQAGDALLQQVGPRIAAATRRGTLVARFGGDEFAVVLDDLVDAAEAVAAAQRIVAAFAEPFLIADFGLDVEASVGIAMYPEHGADNDLLVQRADIAMYVAKANQSGVALYDPADDTHSRERIALLGELRTALTSSEIALHYQPKLDLMTNEVRSVEALVRWDHPEQGLIMPGRFVPLAEHTGLIGPLTSCVLKQAIGQARRWMDAGIEMRVAVNLSTRNLHDVGLPDAVGKLLTEAGLPARLLEFEITESSIMTEPGRARRVLLALHAMGITLAIDDFGTGYSSLAYLQQLPVKEIKIDQSFVSGMLSNSGDEVIVRSTIDLAHNLGLLVTAEGVESAAAKTLLEKTGCDSVQGYLISRPLSAPDLERWLRTRSQEPAPAMASVHSIGSRALLVAQ